MVGETRTVGGMIQSPFADEDVLEVRTANARVLPFLELRETTASGLSTNILESRVDDTYHGVVIVAA